MKHASSPCAGITLTEIMVAIVILGMVMGGFFKVTTMARRTRKLAQSHYAAVIIANNRIERAKQAEFDDLYLLEETETVVNEMGTPDPDGAFLRSTAVHANYDGDPLLKRIVVSVEPPSILGAAAPRSTEVVSTVLTDYLEP